MWFELEVSKTIPLETVPDYCTDSPLPPPRGHLFAFDAAIIGTLRLLVPREAAVDPLPPLPPATPFIMAAIKRRLSSVSAPPSRRTLIYLAIGGEKRN